MNATSAKKKNSRRKLKPYNLYLGVDGGGTKTHAVLIDESGNLIAEATDGASNPLRIGIERAVDNILTAVDTACDLANRHRGDIAAAQIGLAGVRREDLRKTVTTRL